MFKFSFTNKEVLSRNTATYPIDLDDVKTFSFFYEDNPADTSQDDFVNNFLIPTIIDDWEHQTHYLLLDQVIKVYIPDIQYINSNSLEMSLNYLNVRVVDLVNYHPVEWDEIVAKITLDPTFYIITDELLRIASKVKIKKENLPINLFKITNNLESQLQAGFASNDFTNLDPEIKDALSMQVANAIDVKNGYCKGYYNDRIESIYSKFSIEKQLVSII